MGVFFIHRMDVDIKVVNFNSQEQKKCVELRDQMLRKPLGLSFTSDQLNGEIDHIHVAAFKKDSDLVVGCLVLVPHGKSMRMRQVAVHDDYQKKQVGSQLVHFSEEYAKANGCQRIYCHARDVAVNFYKKHNWIIEGDSFMEVGITHYLLTKEL